MCSEQVAEVEKSGAADMIDQLDQLNAQEETLHYTLSGPDSTRLILSYGE